MLTEPPVWEIVVVRDAPHDFDFSHFSPDFPQGAAPWRLVLLASHLAPERFKGPGVIWLISAMVADLDLIAEGCLRLICGPQYIGIEASDLIAVAGGENNPLPLGRASVVPGLKGDEVRGEARQALRALTDGGFDAGVILMQGIAKADEEEWNLNVVDEILTHIRDGVSERDWCLHAYPEAMTSAWTIIAFQSPER